MDRKSIIVLLVSVLLMFAWYGMVNRLYPPRPIAPRTNPVPGPTNSIAAGTNATAPAAVPGISSSSLPVGALVKSDAPEQRVVMENDNARYTFTSHGGGLKLVELRSEERRVGKEGRYRRAADH